MNLKKEATKALLRYDSQDEWLWKPLNDEFKSRPILLYRLTLVFHRIREEEPIQNLRWLLPLAYRLLANLDDGEASISLRKSLFSFVCEFHEPPHCQNHINVCADYCKERAVDLTKAYKKIGSIYSLSIKDNILYLIH